MSATFLQDLVIVTVAATVVTVLFSRLKQPLVIGYLLAGLLIGPYLLPGGIIQDSARVGELAELGLIFLMFALGLEFNLTKLRRHGGTALFIAAVEVAGMIGLGYLLGRSLGWDAVESLFLGAILASTSTTILVKALLELGLIQEEFAEVTIGVTILEDLVVLVLALILQSTAQGGAFDLPALGMLLLQLGLFLAITVSVGILGVPRLLEWVSRHAVDEVLVITVVGLAFAGALAATHLGFGLSLGAFLMGAIVAESRLVRKVESKVVPIRDLFSSLFFVAVGMLLDPRLVVEQWWLVLLLTATLVGGKVLVNWAGSLLAGYDSATSLRIGLAMAQMGEWSLIVAALGLSLGAIPEALYPATVAACSLTMLMAPFVLRASGTVAEAVTKRTPSFLSRAAAAYRDALQGVKNAWRTRDGTLLRDHTYPHKVSLLLFGSWVFGLFLAGFTLFAWVEDRFGALLPFGEEARRGLSLALVGLLGLPLFAAFGRATVGWYTARSRHLTLRPGSLTRRSTGVLPRRALALLLAAGAALALPALSLAVATLRVQPLLLPHWPVTALVIVGLAATAALLWRRLDALSRWLEATLAEMFMPAHRRGTSAYLQKIRDRCPWGVEAVEVVVAASKPERAVALSDRVIQARTGAVVVATVHGTRAVPVRAGEFLASPGDRVILVGSRPQVEEARRLLQPGERLRPAEPMPQAS